MKNKIKYACYVHSLQRTIKNMQKSKSTFCIFTGRQGYMQIKANILYNIDTPSANAGKHATA